MPGEDIYSWSVVAADNGSADTLINWVEGQTRASVNNSARGNMAAHAKNRKLLTGAIVTTGSANAQAFLSGNSYTTIPTNMVVRLKVGSGLTNNASMTLNMDGIGDVLVKTANGNNLLGGEFVGDGYVDLLFNGTNWLFLYGREFMFDRITSGGGIIIGQQIFNTPGTITYTPTPTTECCIVECVGGGGAGGGGSGGVNVVANGAGGGSGGYSRKLLTAAQIGLSQTVTVGAGGAPVTGAAGGAGGPSSLGSYCSANGGSGGVGLGQPGGAGGAVGTGDVVAAGSPGECGSYNPIGAVDLHFNFGGAGGSGPWGGGGVASQSPPNFHVGGSSATNYGSGGGGSSSYNFGAAISGGPGSAGVVIITEFAGKGAPGRDGATGAPGPIGPSGPAGTGTGDVLVSGTPVAGQIAQWVDTSHIKGIDAAAATFTTGDAKITLKTVADTSWVMMNDGTIGSATSGASSRANIDTNALFVLLFNNCNDIYAPILTSAGAATTRATQVNAATAWAANCRMTLTRQLGRSLTIAGTGSGLTAAVLGQFDGAETHVQTVAELAAHNHPPSSPGSSLTTDTNTGVADTGGPYYRPTAFQDWSTTGSMGGNAPMPIVHPRSFWNIMIKL